MKNKETQIFVCSDCGEEYLRWQGKCENCNSWNTLKEFKSSISAGASRNLKNIIPVKISEIKIEKFSRTSTGLEEMDRVLGGKDGIFGFVPGSVVLVGGDPGIGKSTLLLQIAGNLPNILYASAEESLEQIKLRFDRIKTNQKKEEIELVTETNIDSIISLATKKHFDFLVIDSIQTVYSEDFPSTPGSIVQVRECAMKLQKLAKTQNTTVILVGHVTKEGTVAGPKTLEHLVDVVLYLEGERFSQNRILRSIKNRFGTTDEIGIFEMMEIGLQEVKDPSQIFLEEFKTIPGCLVTCLMEGTRPILSEVQALTNPTNFGYPQRRANGFDLNRLQLIAAVISRRTSINLSNYDIYVNFVGGMQTKEPAADLAVALAIITSVKNIKISSKYCIFGELGLSGEVRRVSQEKKRIAEAKRFSFTNFIQNKNINQIIKEIQNV